MDETDLRGFPFQNLKPREDGLNCFCYAGVLIAEEDIEVIRRNHTKFCADWGIDYPLHYNSINSRTKNFDWIGPKNSNIKSNRGEAFVEAYHQFVTSQPFKVIGSVVDKSYFADEDNEDQRFMTIEFAFFEILRSILFKGYLNTATVKIYFESVGKKEDKEFRSNFDSFWAGLEEDEEKNS